MFLLFPQLCATPRKMGQNNLCFKYKKYVILANGYFRPDCYNSSRRKKIQPAADKKQRRIYSNNEDSKLGLYERKW